MCICMCVYIYRKGHKSLGDQEPFMGEETGSTCVISLVEGGSRRNALLLMNKQG